MVYRVFYLYLYRKQVMAIVVKKVAKQGRDVIL